MDKSSPTKSSRFVPYITDAVLPEAAAHLPKGPESRLTAAEVERFVADTRARPEVRMAVFGVLRAHASYGAEVGISLMALLVAVLGFALGLLNTVTRYEGWLGLIPVLEVIGVVLALKVVIQAAVAAHIRKMTAVTWLGAYQDALADASRGLRLEWRGCARSVRLATPRRRQLRR